MKIDKYTKEENLFTVKDAIQITQIKARRRC